MKLCRIVISFGILVILIFFVMWMLIVLLIIMVIRIYVMLLVFGLKMVVSNVIVILVILKLFFWWDVLCFESLVRLKINRIVVIMYVVVINFLDMCYFLVFLEYF